MTDESPARITRVRLKNYKSIVSCDVELRPLTILVGPNGSGKSNFVDALRFVQQALALGLDRAISNRGGVRRILSKGRPAGDDAFGIALDFRLSSGETGRFEFTIDGFPQGEYHVVKERLVLCGVDAHDCATPYEISNGEVSMRMPDREASVYRTQPRVHLFLPGYAAFPEARPIDDLLSSMAFYNPDSAAMRALTPAEPAPRLKDDGRNVATILRQIKSSAPETFWRITTYLSRVLPGLERIDVDDLSGYDLLTFHHAGHEEGEQRGFMPDQMSDGTLRALAVLVALFQSRMGGKSQVSLIGIEEPETGLHPAATGALLHALMDASVTSQVLVTTHSSDLLDSDDVDVDCLLAVVSENGVTQIGPVDEVGRSLLRDRLYTAGELLSISQLRPAASAEDDSPMTATPAPAPS